MQSPTAILPSEGGWSVRCSCGHAHDHTAACEDCMSMPMVQCASCAVWYHIACVSGRAKRLPAHFQCRPCRASGVRSPASSPWSKSRQRRPAPRPRALFRESRARTNGKSFMRLPFEPVVEFLSRAETLHAAASCTAMRDAVHHPLSWQRLDAEGSTTLSPCGLSSLLGRHFAALVHVNLAGTAAADSAAVSALLAAAPRLTSLDVSHCPFICFRAFPKSAERPSLAAAASLTSLALSGCSRVGPDAVPGLQRLIRLRRLNVSRTGLDTDAITRVAIACPDLREVVAAAGAAARDSRSLQASLREHAAHVAHVFTHTVPPSSGLRSVRLVQLPTMSGAEAASEGIIRALGTDSDVAGYVMRQQEEFERRGATRCALPSTAEAVAWVWRSGISVDVWAAAASGGTAQPSPVESAPPAEPASHPAGAVLGGEITSAQRAQLQFEIARDAFVAETFLVTTPLSLCLWERLLRLHPCALGHLHAAWLAYMLFHVERCLHHIVRALQLQPELGTAWHDLGSLLREMGSPHSALACHTRAAECRVFEETSAHQTWVSLADTYTSLRDPRGALLALLQASRAAPSNEEVQEKLQRKLAAARRRWRERMAREAVDSPHLTSVAALGGANAVPSAAARDVSAHRQAKRRRPYAAPPAQPTRRGRVVAPPPDLAAQYVSY